MSEHEDRAAEAVREILLRNTNRMISRELARIVVRVVRRELERAAGDGEGESE